MDLTNLCIREVVGIDAQASLRDAAALSAATLTIHPFCFALLVR